MIAITESTRIHFQGTFSLFHCTFLFVNSKYGSEARPDRSLVKTSWPRCNTPADINENPFILLGVQPLSFRQVKKLVSFEYPSVSWMIPEFVYVPRWLMAASSHKF